MKVLALIPVILLEVSRDFPQIFFLGGGEFQDNT